MKKSFLRYLQLILRFLTIGYLKRLKPKIVAITGSAGKTTTKEAIYLVLSENLKDYQVRKSWSNLNNEVGLPLAIFGVKRSVSGLVWPILIIWLFVKLIGVYLSPKRENTVLVLEMAADKPGDIHYLTSMCPPDIAVVTNIGYAHLQAFGNLGKIAQEKGQLVRALKDDGWAVLNADDSLVHQMGLANPNHTIFYGIENKAAVWAKDIIIGKQTHLKIEMAGKIYNWETSSFGEHQIYAFLAALGVGHIFNLDVEKMLESLNHFSTLKGRAKVIELKDNVILIDDTYNANPASMEAGLKFLGQVYKAHEGGRKIAILGDMLELGQITQTAHEQIGKLAKEESDVLYTIGNFSRSMKGEKHFDDSRAAAEYLKEQIQPNDILLIKGSRAIKMDYIIDYLVKENK